MVHVALKQAMKTAEHQKQPIAVTHLQHEFGVMNEMDQELHHFLREALEIVRGAEREPGLGQWRRLAAFYDPLAAGRSLDDSRQILSPPKAAQTDDLAHTIQALDNLEQRHRERTGDPLPKDTRQVFLISMYSFCRYHSQRCLMKEELVADCTRNYHGRWSAPVRLAQGYTSSSPTTRDMWLGNKLVDELAKVVARQRQAQELAVFVGQVNAVANAWPGIQEQSDALQQMGSWARNAPKFEPDVKCYLSVNFPACSVCQMLGVYQRLPIKAPQYDISSEGEDRPSDNSHDGEWWPDEVDLNAVTIGNMSIDSKPVATDDERGRYRGITVDSGAGESVVSPDDWPHVELKLSKGSLKGQRTVRGPWRWQDWQSGRNARAE